MDEPEELNKCRSATHEDTEVDRKRDRAERVEQTSSRGKKLTGRCLLKGASSKHKVMSTRCECRRFVRWHVETHRDGDQNADDRVHAGVVKDLSLRVVSRQIVLDTRRARGRPSVAWPTRRVTQSSRRAV